MLFLGPFFFLVWGVSSWITALRSDVGTFYFEWEKSIPFVPLMLIPYMSVDLFFGGSTFLCTSRVELHTLAKRIVFAILVSAAGFLLFPLRLGFARPRTSTPFDQAFDLLAFMIGDYNLFPSLHISLRWIIWDVYRRHTRGLLQWAIGTWFILIALSTVLGYQHHVIDVGGGDVVAVLAFYLFRQPGEGIEPGSVRRDRRTGDAGAGRNPRIGRIYASLSVASLTLVYLGWPWTVVLAWPAVALAILAGAYWGMGPAVFRKTGGRLPFSATMVLGPYLLGAHLSFRHYRRAGPAYGEVVPGVVIGRKLSGREADDLVRRGVTAVLDLTAEYGEARPLLRLPYQNVQILDLTVPSREQLAEAVDFVRAQVPGGRVYVHCALGYSRSACVAAAYLLAQGLAPTVEDAVRAVERSRPRLVMTPGLIGLLRAYRATAPGDGAPARA